MSFSKLGCPLFPDLQFFAFLLQQVIVQQYFKTEEEGAEGEGGEGGGEGGEGGEEGGEEGERVKAPGRLQCRCFVYVPLNVKISAI